MKTITKTYEVYNYDELSEEAKNKAYSKWYEAFEYFWSSDNEATLKAFEKIFPIKIKNWEYGYHNNIDFTMTCDEHIKKLSGVRLLKYLWNNYWLDITKAKYLGWVKGKPIYSKINREWDNCALTGYHLDNYIIAPIIEFMKKPSSHKDFEDLINDCLYSWVYACDKDYNYCSSKEYFIEETRNNMWMYKVDGTMSNL